MVQMRCHDPELECLLLFAHVVVALREDTPCRRGTRLDTDDLLHDTNSLWDIRVDVGLVAFADECADLLRENGTVSSSTLYAPVHKNNGSAAPS